MRKPIILAIYSHKLHEFEKKINRGGGARHQRPLGSANVFESSFMILLCLFQIHINNCTFSNDRSLLPTHRALAIRISARTEPLDIVIQNSTFARNLYVNPLDSVLNLYSAVLHVRVTVDRESRYNPTVVALHITGTLPCDRCRINGKST